MVSTAITRSDFQNRINNCHYNDARHHYWSFAGVYVDKFNRRDIIIIANIFQAIIVTCIAVLYSFGQLSFLVLLPLLFLLNAGAQFVRPAVSAAIPRIIEKENLATANGLFSISSSANQIIGYGIGGLLVLLLGIAIPIYYDRLTFIIAATAIVLIVRPILAVPKSNPNNETTIIQQHTRKPESFTSKFLQGYGYIRTNRLLVELIVLAVALNFFGGGVQTFNFSICENYIER
jgi:MFS family permease